MLSSKQQLNLCICCQECPANILSIVIVYWFLLQYLGRFNQAYSVMWAPDKNTVRKIWFLVNAELAFLFPCFRTLLWVFHNSQAFCPGPTWNRREAFLEGWQMEWLHLRLWSSSDLPRALLEQEEKTWLQISGIRREESRGPWPQVQEGCWRGHSKMNLAGMILAAAAIWIVLAAATHKKTMFLGMITYKVSKSSMHIQIKMYKLTGPAWEMQFAALTRWASPCLRWHCPLRWWRWAVTLNLSQGKQKGVGHGIIVWFWNRTEQYGRRKWAGGWLSEGKTARLFRRTANC